MTWHTTSHVVQSVMHSFGSLRNLICGFQHYLSFVPYMDFLHGLPIHLSASPSLKPSLTLFCADEGRADLGPSSTTTWGAVERTCPAPPPGLPHIGGKQGACVVEPWSCSSGVESRSKFSLGGRAWSPNIFQKKWVKLDLTFCRAFSADVERVF